jgi:hypothetical protein
MKNKSFVQTLTIAFVITTILVSCEMKSDDSMNMMNQENTLEAASIGNAIANMAVYNDSCQIAKIHASERLHHYDSVYHHHDSLYNHHHKTYHHGDSSHHIDWHHNEKQHHKHDSLNNDHHKRIH